MFPGLHVLSVVSSLLRASLTSADIVRKRINGRMTRRLHSADAQQHHSILPGFTRTLAVRQVS
jgi:hypothetical protein